MNEALNPSPIIAPGFSSKALVASSNSVANLLPAYDSAGNSRLLSCSQNLPHRRFYFGFVIAGVTGLSLRSQLVWSRQGEQALVVPVNITSFDSGDVASIDDALLPCWDVERIVSDYGTGRQYGENATTRQGLGGPDAMRFDTTIAPPSGGSLFETYRFTLFPLRLAIVADSVQWQIREISGTLVGSQASLVGVMGVLSSSFPS